MTKIFRKYWWIAIIIIIVPLVLLIFVCNRQAAAWLPFWGSYLGSVIVASISFIILYRTIEANKREAEIRRQEERIDRIKEHLSTMIGQIDSMFLLVALLYLENVESCRNAILLLDSYNKQLTANLKRHIVIYGANDDAGFTEAYTECVHKMRDDIYNINRTISDIIRAYNNNLSTEQIISDIENTLAPKINKDVETHIILVNDKIIMWLGQEETKLNELKKY